MAAFFTTFTDKSVNYIDLFTLVDYNIPDSKNTEESMSDNYSNHVTNGTVSQDNGSAFTENDDIMQRLELARKETLSHNIKNAEQILRALLREDICQHPTPQFCLYAFLIIAWDNDLSGAEHDYEGVFKKLISLPNYKEQNAQHKVQAYNRLAKLYLTRKQPDYVQAFKYSSDAIKYDTEPEKSKLYQFCSMLKIVSEQIKTEQSVPQLYAKINQLYDDVNFIYDKDLPEFNYTMSYAYLLLFAEAFDIVPTQKEKLRGKNIIDNFAIPEDSHPMIPLLRGYILLNGIGCKKNEKKGKELIDKAQSMGTDPNICTYARSTASSKFSGRSNAAKFFLGAGATIVSIVLIAACIAVAALFPITFLLVFLSYCGANVSSSPTLKDYFKETADKTVKACSAILSCIPKMFKKI